MHDTARISGAAFFAKYGEGMKSVLDVGSKDVNGTLRPFIPEGAEYVGLDVEPGPNVHMILKEPDVFPWPGERFDIVISSSCLEHDAMFWLTFKEMARAAKNYIYLSVPSAGPVHRFPIDAWRFFPDAGEALAKWARYCGFKVKLLESFIIPPRSDVWYDFVAVFGKGDASSFDLAASFPEATDLIKG